MSPFPKYLLLVLSILLAESGCKSNSPTAPVPVPEWKADTIYAHADVLLKTTRIRAYDANRIFLIGHNHLDKGFVYRIDGDSIFQVLMPDSSDVISDILPLSAMDFIAVGYSTTGQSRIYRGDGTSWQGEPMNAYGNRLTAVGGSTADGIWAGGYDGTFYQFNGQQWNLDNFFVRANEPVFDSLTMYIDLIQDRPHKGPIIMTHVFRHDQGWEGSCITEIFGTIDDPTSWHFLWNSLDLNGNGLYGLAVPDSSTAIVGGADYLYYSHISWGTVSFSNVQLGYTVRGIWSQFPNEVLATRDHSLIREASGMTTDISPPNVGSATLTAVWSDGNTIVVSGFFQSNGWNIVLYRFSTS